MRCEMNETIVYRGKVRTGRGASASIMISSGALDGFRQWTGLSVIPGTLNILFTKPFDLKLLHYIATADMGLKIDFAELGIKFEGEAGWYYSLAVVAERYHSFIYFPTWTDDPTRYAEIMSTHHLRSTLNLQDGDPVEFTLVEKFS